ncbi:HNH endonuclease [Rossellomorea vietnamensis]|uniref:HNH endonuclease n=1 Tax=Rossellomorea vietnamensis TaxID=218284 RepID=UPI003CE8F8E2
MRHKNLIPYTDETTTSIYTSIVSTKQRPCRDILSSDTSPNSIKDIILERYEKYEENIYTLENIQPLTFTKEEKGCLEGCYTSETADRVALINNIMSKRDVHSKAICCYCGYGNPKTIDHYLPKSIFPEFSIHSLNLIPCCSDCNNIKDNYFVDENSGERLFINFYFDDIPDESYLFANIVREEKGFIIEYMFEAPNNDKVYSIVSSHIEKLKIISRLEEISNSYIDDIFNQHQYSLYEGVQESTLRDTLAMNTRVLERQHGKNYWKVVLNNAIMNCDDFFEILT